MAYEYQVTNKRYHTLDYYLKTKYGKKVFKIPLNASFSCPNRDGTKGIGGCTFCSNKGSGDFAGNPLHSLNQQYDEMIKVMERKWPDAYYIVYFQAYTNTYGSLKKLKETYEPFIGKEKVIGMSIATRPDCIDEEIVAYLSELKTHFKEFWIELGLQTSFDKTANLIHRCYSYSCFEKAVHLLDQAKIQIVVHIIDGLPHETKKMMIQTIKKLNKLPLFGIKIHMLNIIKGTKIAQDYQKQKLNLLTEEEFVDIVVDQLQYLKGSIIVHRIGGDSDAQQLIAPQWVLKKLSVVDKIDQKMEEKGVFQGDLFV